jgi:hypothetical protein
MNKRAFLDGYLIADALALELELRRAPPGLGGEPLPPWVLPGLARLPELVIDPRLEYLRFGLERWREERGADPEAALVELEEARALRRTAVDELRRAADALALVEEAGTRAAWRELLERVAEYAKAMFLALDHVQRAWGKADADFLIGPMYRFLHDVYPPRLPAVLAELAERWDWAPTSERLQVPPTSARGEGVFPAAH